MNNRLRDRGDLDHGTAVRQQQLLSSVREVKVDAVTLRFDLRFENRALHISRG